MSAGKCAHCDRRANAPRGMCWGCYNRERRYGSPDADRGTRHGLLDKAIDDAIASATDECIEWAHGCFTNGYGQYNHRKATHVVLERLGHRRPSKSHIVLHSCDNPPCVNPRHIRWGTHSENMADRDRRRRTRNQWTGPLDDEGISA